MPGSLEVLTAYWIIQQKYIDIKWNISVVLYSDLNNNTNKSQKERNLRIPVVLAKNRYIII